MLVYGYGRLILGSSLSSGIITFHGWIWTLAFGSDTNLKSSSNKYIIRRNFTLLIRNGFVILTKIIPQFSETFLPCGTDANVSFFRICTRMLNCRYDICTPRPIKKIRV